MRYAAVTVNVAGTAETRIPGEVDVTERLFEANMPPGRPGRASFMRHLVVAIFSVLIAACGGGGGGDPAGGNGGAGDAPSPPPTESEGPTTGNALPGPRPLVKPTEFAHYESGQVRPLALSRDGSRLYVVNTPDNRLEIFSTGGRLRPLASVLVGLEPVAVAEGPEGRVWVVNHLSDSVSIVEVDSPAPRVVRTLQVGDEPRDIVFAGEGGARAFITTAHRGQNSPVDPALNVPGIGRADVWVVDAEVADHATDDPVVDILTLFGDRPRPLAVSSDGLRVYAGIFLSGNQTTSIAPNQFPKAAPTNSADGVKQPDSGLILRYNGRNWVDEQGVAYDRFVPFSLPDFDVFEIDAMTLATTSRYKGVGTILFNMAVNPATDVLYVSNLDSRNHVRFSGVASRASTTVRGRVADHQITVVENGNVGKRLLNKHLDFSAPEASQSDRSLSLSLPLGLAVTRDGNALYVAAFGSGKVGVYDTAALEDDSFVPERDRQIAVSGGGPTGIVLDEDRGLAYVMTRFDNGISTLDLDQGREVDHLRMFNPEPEEIVRGRVFMYDATLTSGNGNDSCGSCHIFGDTDGLAWDLGEPDGRVKPISNVFIPISPAASPERFHPMKGPMATQSMRGLTGHGPMHWRGDRSGSERENGETLEEAAFKEFDDAFDAFFALGRGLDEDDLQDFTDFAMAIRYPPNPIRQLDNTLVGRQVRGATIFRRGVVRVQTGLLEVCVQCHTLDPAAGLFGTKGLSSDNSQAGEKNFKIPHFRDQYQKVGMFGWAFAGPPATGPQIRGFSFNHNGATSSNFIIADLGMPTDDLLAIRDFLYAFPTESPPITGQQETMGPDSETAVAERVDLLMERAAVEMPVPECDLVVTGVVGGEPRGWVMTEPGRFRSDRGGESTVSRQGIENMLHSSADRLTWSCVPWGSGRRIAIDRDLDGVLNGDE